MAVGQQVTVTMSGGPPYGFRLIGGDEEPLVVAKLRKRSKAADAGMVEGDVLLSINGQSCQGMSHSNAMQLVDQATANLTMEMLRGGGSQHAVNASVQELGGPQFKSGPSPAQQAPQSLGRGAFQPTYQLSTGRAPPSQAQPGFTAPMGSQVLNGYGGGDFDQPLMREEQTFHEGDTTRHVTTETRTENVGGNLLTKVTRQEVSQTTGGSFQPIAPQPAGQGMFQVSKFGAGGKKPGVWTPSSGGISVNAPSGVQVERNPDKSITMTIGMGMGMDESKENIAPQQSLPAKPVPQFNVARVTSEQSKNQWQPAGPQPFRPQPQPPQQPPQQGKPMSKKWTPPAPQMPIPRFALPPREDEFETPPESPIPPLKPLDISRILRHDIAYSSGDEGSDSPGSFSRRRSGTDTGSDDELIKKLARNMYADSSFYNDPAKKYPTIEEQIKMARKVALSLMAPANEKARGHNMFMKRRQKSTKWVAGSEVPDEFHFSDSDEEKYYKPEPWKGGQIWQPPAAPPLGRMLSMDAKPLDTSVYGAPKLPSGPDMEEKQKALSAEEFERLRLYEQKTMHNSVAPQVCFSLAEALRSAKGKGGKMFQKRKEKSEKWVVQENPNQPNPELLARIAASSKAGQQHGVQEQEAMDVAPPQGRARLMEMINPPKAACTPWDAAADDPLGKCDRAFDHLRAYKIAKANPTNENILASNLTSAATHKTPGVLSGPSAKAASSQPSYNHKMTPWGGAPSSGGGPASGGPPMPVRAPAPGPAASSFAPGPASGPRAPIYKNPVKTWQPGASPAAPFGGFKPVGFKAKSMNDLSGAASSQPDASSSWQQPQEQLPVPAAALPAGSPGQLSPRQPSPSYSPKPPSSSLSPQQSPPQGSPHLQGSPYRVSPHLQDSPYMQGSPQARGSPLVGSPHMSASPQPSGLREISVDAGFCDL